VIRSIEALQEAVKFLSLGLDYRRYVKFRLLTPYVVRFGEKYKVIGTKRSPKWIPTAEDVHFCIDFIIESALTLQEFDFEVERQTLKL